MTSGESGATAVVNEKPGVSSFVTFLQSGCFTVSLRAEELEVLLHSHMTVREVNTTLPVSSVWGLVHGSAYSRRIIDRQQCHTLVTRGAPVAEWRSGSVLGP